MFIPGPPTHQSNPPVRPTPPLPRRGGRVPFHPARPGPACPLSLWAAAPPLAGGAGAVAVPPPFGVFRLTPSSPRERERLLATSSLATPSRISLPFTSV